ncbi:MAG: hypothetical protein EA363_03820 [Balneolaceae bacterium]|nr:MAG: hypothetical protein EA363_03820 [Balneolaceae bacterium]
MKSHPSPSDPTTRHFCMRLFACTTTLAQSMAAILLLFALSSCGDAGEHHPGNDGNDGRDAHGAGTIIVASKSGDDVHFIDRDSGETLLVLPTGREPHEVEVSGDGRIAVVTNYGDREVPGNTLSVYDVLEGTLVRTIDLGEHTRPHGLWWMGDTDRVLVTTEGTRTLLVVDAVRGEMIRALRTEQDISHMVAATPDLSRAFVPSIRTGNVTVFDLESGELLAQVYSGAGAEGIDVHPEGHEVWVTNRADNTIAIIDTESLEVLDIVASEDFPIRGKFTPDGRYFLVSNARSGDIGVFDTAKRELVASITLTPPVPEGVDETRYFSEFEGSSIPIGLVVPDNSTAYVANTRSDAVSIIDLETMTITGHFDSGREPDGINFSPLRPLPEQMTPQE